MAQLFLIAYRNLVQHTRRSLLLGGAIAGVSALLVFLICLTSGIRHTMLESAFAVSTGHLNVGGFYKYAPGLSAPLVTRHREVLKVVRAALPDVDFIAARGRGFGKLVSETGSVQAALAGVDVAEEPGLRRTVQISEGSLDGLAKPDTIMLFATHAKKLGVKVGDQVVVSVLTPRGTNNTLDLRVAAVAKDMGFLSSWNVFIPMASLQRLHQLNDESTGSLLVYLKDKKHVERDLEKLKAALTAAGFPVMDRSPKPYWMKFDGVNREEWTGQKLDLTSWQDELSYMSWTLTAVDSLMYVLTIVLLVIIAVGIMNSMWIAIRERTREIGTLRAIGMQRRRVLAMFLIEAFSLGALGTAAGTVLGLALAGALHAARLPVPELAQLFLMSSVLRFAVDPGRIFTGMAVITGCATLVAVIPSIHAARLKPVTAMSHLG